AVGFLEDFSDGELDRSIWNVRVTGRVVNDENQAYIDSPDTVFVAPEDPGSENNVLVLRGIHRPGHLSPEGRSFDFVSGRVDTRDRVDFRYGEASARIKLPVGVGLWPAFWAMGYGRWPDTGEIDIMEYVGESDWVSSAVHGPGYSGEGGLVNKLFSTDGAAADWHVYSVRREPDQMVFAVDGVSVYRVTKPMTEFFGTWEFDDDKFLILNLALGGTYPFKTNGVRAPYYGLPHETVERIKADEVRVLVDWVRVDDA
ncbi:MAG: glycoside hydrolase family 16 protein, partial [Acidimicrobiia bacterium]|nr:glycoside hydrolase family 16 protein [Acidimicrobiia bacterium]